MLVWMWSWGRTKHKESGWVKMDTPLVPPGRASVGWMGWDGAGLGSWGSCWSPGRAEVPKVIPPASRLLFTLLGHAGS